MRFVPTQSGVSFKHCSVTLQSLLNIHRIATEKNDVHLADFLESEYLQEQVDSMKEIADFITNLKRVGDGLGVYMFDRQLTGDGSS